MSTNSYCHSLTDVFCFQPEDGGLEAGVLEDEEYDALNDETFGSAAVDGDWEESHEHLSSLAEARKRDGARATHHHQSQEVKIHLLPNCDENRETWDNGILCVLEI